jgi:hypothetical protein
MPTLAVGLISVITPFAGRTAPRGHGSLDLQSTLEREHGIQREHDADGGLAIEDPEMDIAVSWAVRPTMQIDRAAKHAAQSVE